MPSPFLQPAQTFLTSESISRGGEAIRYNRRIMIFPVETATPLPLGEIEEICRRRGVRRLAVFGSMVGVGFRADSDVDFLVEFEAGSEQPWMAHLTELQQELAERLGRSVDVVDWAGVERSRNPFRRHGILSGSRLLYAA